MSLDRLVLSKATLEDLPDLVELERICSTHSWDPAAFDAAVRAEGGSCVLALRRLDRQALSGGAHGLEEGAIAQNESGLIAFCVLQTIIDELHIHKLCVRPGGRRSGFGRLLLESALRLGVRLGAQRAILEVRAGNEEARRLYSALGFRCVARRSDYYAQPTEDALIMEKTDLKLT